MVKKQRPYRGNGFFFWHKNLQTTITIGSNLAINVTAKRIGDFFQVYFGDVANEVPVNFMEGEVVTHTYARAGTYQVKVVAKWWSCNKSKIEAVTVTNLLQHQYQQFPLLM
jgi:hypothetical protein